MRKFIEGGSRSPLLDQGDKRLILALTLLYTVFTLINLGTLSFPQSQWVAPDEAITVDLGEERQVSAIWFNGGIAVGKLRITGDDGTVFDYDQQYGEMYSWRKKDAAFLSRYLLLEKTGGSVVLNEIAFLDQKGNLIQASADGRGAALLDEQNTVPERRTYLNGMYFDEIYHARTAYEFLHGMSVYEWTHPPLGKLLIAVGVAIFGMTPFGWRVVPALFGAGMLPVFFTLAKRLFRRRDLAFLAAALLALDTMHFTQTRIATVDVFIVFFILLMFLFMTDYIRLDSHRQPLRKVFVPLGACGISFGLGVASKWTGLYAGVGLAVLFFLHLILMGLRSKRDVKEKEFIHRAVLTCLFCVIFFVVLPAVIYFLSYIPFFRYELAVRKDVTALSFREMLDIVIQQQKSMYSYHSKLTATHLCQSTWYEWPFTAKSVWFYSGSMGNRVSNIATFGSPAVWWVSAVMTVCIVVEAAFGRIKSDPTYRKKSLVILLIASAANYFPWMTVPRCTFQYHFFPTMPFMLLIGVLFVQHMEENREFSPGIKWWWLLAAGIYFVLLLPASSGIPVPRLYAQFMEYVLPTGVLFHGAV